MPKIAKPKKPVEPEYTDILEEFFFEDGTEKIRKTYMKGDKKVRVEIVNS